MPGKYKVFKCHACHVPAKYPFFLALKPGDGGICFNCGELGIVDSSNKIRPPTPEEFAKFKEMPNWPKIEAHQQRIFERGVIVLAE
jgi:hypothetical protein